MHHHRRHVTNEELIFRLEFLIFDWQHDGSTWTLAHHSQHYKTSCILQKCGLAICMQRTCPPEQQRAHSQSFN